MTDRTKLDAMIGYLAGRDADAALLDELADPSSEASRFLEATRLRSKALLDVAETPTRRGRSPVGWWLIGIAVGLVAAGLALALVEWRVRRIASEAAREARDRDRAVEAAIDRLVNRSDAGPIADALGEVDERLGQIERRLEAIDRRPRPAPSKAEPPKVEPSKADPSIAEVRDELASLRRDLSALEKGSSREFDEARAANHEVVRLLKLIYNNRGQGGEVPR